MDNKLGRAMSSMTDLKQALKNSVPRIGRRKSSLAAPANSGPTGATDEEANAVISKIPHSPSTGTLLTKETDNSSTIRKTSGESPEIGFNSYLANYFGQNYKQAAMNAISDGPHADQKTPSFVNDKDIDGISLSTLYELARIAPKPAETDEQWDWQEVFIQTSTTRTKARQQEMAKPGQKSSFPSSDEKGRILRTSDPVAEISVGAKSQSSRFSFPSQLASQA